MRTFLRVLTRLGVCLFFVAPMVLPWQVGLRRAAVLGFLLTVAVYIAIQGFTSFRHPLHGALVLTILALAYGSLVTAFSGARKRTAVTQRALNHRPALDAASTFCFHSVRRWPRASEAERYAVKPGPRYAM